MSHVRGRVAALELPAGRPGTSEVKLPVGMVVPATETEAEQGIA